MQLKIVLFVVFLFLVFLACNMDSATTPSEKSLPNRHDPFTPEMRVAYQRIHTIHNGMDKKTINAAVDQLFNAIDKYEPEVFVPLVMEDLMRLAPKDKRTISLLHQCLEEGWLTPTDAHSCLVQVGEPAKEHIDYLISQLDSPDTSKRIAAIGALGMCGAKAEAALPRLEKIVLQSNAPQEDYVKDYSIKHPMPEHVHAKIACDRIKRDLQSGGEREDKEEEGKGEEGDKSNY
jgi:hypothetical protein